MALRGDKKGGHQWRNSRGKLQLFSGVEISLASFLKLYFPRLYRRPDDIKPPFFMVVKANVNSKLKVVRLKRTFTAIYEANSAVFAVVEKGMQ